MSPNLLERVKARTVEEGDCWLWQGAKTGEGYPCMYMAGRSELVSRLVAMEAGPLPKKMVSMSCHSKECVNPAHIRLMAWKQIAQESAKRGNQDSLSKRIKLARHKRSQSKLKQADIPVIRNSNEPLKVMAERYGVSMEAISKIRRGIRWAAIGSLF